MISSNMILVRPVRGGGYRNVTYRTIERSLAARWKSLRVIRPKNEWELFRFLLPRAGELARPFVFNAALYLDGFNKRGFIPHLLETWGYPHLGSTAAVVRSAQDEATLKRVLRSRGIPVWEALGTRPDGDAQRRTPRSRLSLSRRAQRFFVGILGSTGRLRFPVEVELARVAVHVPFMGMVPLSSVRDERALQIIQELADRAFDAVNAEDYAAVEILSNRGGFAVLGIDVMPDLGQWSLFSVAAQRCFGIEHDDLIRMIAATSLARQPIVYYS